MGTCSGRTFSGRKFSNPDLRKLVKRVERAGWRVEPTRDGWKMFSPNGTDIVTVHTSSSDKRALKNTVGDLRRAGLDLQVAGG
jgi:hypothetical protein